MDNLRDDAIETEDRSNPENSSIRILIVDDEESSRETLGELLAIHDFKVKTVNTARNALDTLEQDSFDLIFSDLIGVIVNCMDISAQFPKNMGCYFVGCSVCTV